MLCGRVIIIDRGRIVAEDTAATLARRVEGAARTALRVAGPRPEIVAALAGLSWVDRVDVAEDGAESDAATVRLVVVSREGDAARRAIAALVVERGWGLLELRPIEPSLEELFVRLLGAERGGPADA